MNTYESQNKNLKKLIDGNPTTFLDLKQMKILKGKLKKEKYNIYYPYIDSEKVIFYKNKKPSVILFKIICDNLLTHQDILGTIFSLGLTKDTFGDIIIDDSDYYFYILDTYKNYVIDNLKIIKNHNVYLKEIDINLLKNYKRKYEELNFIVSSLRIDLIVSAITHINREKVKDMIKNKDIILNYEYVSSPFKKLNENDIFSIRKYGKYKYEGIKLVTKNNKYLIKCYKYI